MRGTEVLLHPALVANLHRVVNIAVHIRHSGVTRTRQTVTLGFQCLGGKGLVIAVSRACTIGGICPDMVGRHRLKIAQLDRETAQTAARSEVIILDRRVGSGAPAETALRDSGVAVRIDNASADGTRSLHIGHLRGD